MGGTSGGRGGIGRHARFRFSCRKAWGFKSLRPHQTESGSEDDASDGTLGRRAEAAIQDRRPGRRPVGQGRRAPGRDGRDRARCRASARARCRSGCSKKQYGQALFGEALEQAVNSSTAKAIEDRGLKPALQPRVDLKQLEEGKDVEFEVAIEVLPEIGKLDFSEVELERLKAVVPDKDVEEAIGRIAKANREQKPVDPPRPAQKGDAIKLDFVGSVDGKEFPGGAAQDYTLELGSGSFIPGFEDQLVGAEVGKDVDVKVTLPGRLRRARARRQGRRLQVHDQGDPRVRRQAGRR